MRRYIRTVLLLPLLLSVVSCQLESVSDSSFEIGITYPKATGLLYEVIPQTNDYYYTCDAVSVADYERMGEDAVLDSLNTFNKAVYEIIEMLYEEYLGLSAPAFRDILENGAIYGSLIGLSPETNYYLCITCYNKRNRPMKPIVKQVFMTKDSLASSIMFDVQANGLEVFVAPSNDEKYFWSVIEKGELDRRYLGLPEYFYLETIENFERYGFINTVLTQGKDSIDLSYLRNLQVQDTLYLVTAGYYNETNSKTFAYELVYQRGDTFSIKLLESQWDEFSSSRAENVARRLFRKNAVSPRFKR